MTNFTRPDSGVAITLMTPEPKCGLYQVQGVEAFVRRFGYADQLGRADRLNFGGIHKVGERHGTTQLTLTLQGFDVSTGRITDANGSLALVSAAGEVAAAWPFNGLLEHWAHKHARAVYVPSQCRKEPARQYHYGHTVRLAQGTDPLRLLRALAAGGVLRPRHQGGAGVHRAPGDETPEPVPRGVQAHRRALRNGGGGGGVRTTGKRSTSNAQR